MIFVAVLLAAFLGVMLGLVIEACVSRNRGGMKLYRISQNVNGGYDTYDCAVVCAPDEETARRWEIGSGDSWALPEHVQVEYLGEAKDGASQALICASFNAG
jgi:hypothetical protein